MLDDGAIACGEARLGRELLARHQLLERGLESLFPHHDPTDHPVDLFEHRRHRAVVHAKRPDLPLRFFEPREQSFVGGEIGVAPAVDRLLRIADDEEAGSLARRSFERECGNDPALARIGVLEFVDEQLVDVAAQSPRHVRVLAQERVGAGEQHLEGHRAAALHAALRVLAQRRDHARHGGELRDVELLEVCEERGQDAGGGVDGRLPVAEGIGLPLREFALRPLRPFLQFAERGRIPGAPDARDPLGEFFRPLARLAHRHEAHAERRSDRDRALRALRHRGDGVAYGLSQGVVRANQPLAQRVDALGRERIGPELVRIRTARDHCDERGFDLLRAAFVRHQRERGVVALRVRPPEAHPHGFAHRRRARRAVGIDFEERMQTGLDGMGRQQPSTPGVDRLDEELIEPGAQRLDAISWRVGVEAHRPLALREIGERFLDTRLHLCRGGFGERDRHDPAQHALGDAHVRRVRRLRARAVPARPEAPRQHACDERRRLPRAGTGLDRDRARELALREGATVRIRLAGLVPVERVHSDTCQTARAAFSTDDASSTSLVASSHAPSRRRTPLSPRRHACRMSQ